jgi:hypothetical protein
MTYNEIGLGGLRVSGCWVITVSHIYITAYGIGDILYDVKKARRGVLERIVIKQIVPVKQSLTGGQFVALYKDTLNGLWNENDLVSSATAKAMAENYYTQLLAQIAALEAATRC